MAKEPLRFGGEESFAAPPEKLFALLVDLETLGRAMPDVESAERIDERSVKCVVRPGFSFLRGKLTSTIVLDDVVENQSATMRIHNKGIGVEMRIETRWSIAARDGGSQLAWQAEVVEMKGLVATLGGTLVQAAAQQTINKSWDAVRQELGESAAG